MTTATTPDVSEKPGALKRLVRSLSRSSPRLERPGSRERNGAVSPGAAALSTSPPPDSYFPHPPRATLRDAEASGRARHPDSVGARAFDLPADPEDKLKGSSAPGVSFAPTAPDTKPKEKEDPDAWNPQPRRTQSTRRAAREGATGPPSTASTNPALANARARASTTEGQQPLQRGVTLEDKPLSRKTSVSRAASAVRKAVEKAAFVMNEKVEGEQRVMIMVADGSEEIEVLTPYDVFVRASLNPTLVSISPQFSPSQSMPYITLSRGAKLLADTQFETLKDDWKNDFDAIIIPGGAKGAERLSECKELQQLIWTFYESGKTVGMICAGTLAAKTSGLPEGMRVTSHPSVKGDLEKHFTYSEDRVVIDKNLITSRGPGTALEFSLQIVEIMAGKAKRDEVAGPMML